MASTMIAADVRLPPRFGGAAATDVDISATTLIIENMHCGGCLKKVEAALSSVPGVITARANLSTRRAEISHKCGPSGTLAFTDALDAAGFKSSELAAGAALTATNADRDYLQRLAVAGFAAANVMLLSVSVWSGGGDMSSAQQGLFHWLSALIALPAIGFAGQPFFRSAATALRAGRVNMDVPISLGVSLATLMSLYQTIRGTEQVYFDAAVTLLFFLLIGRALDARMRVRAAGSAANLLGLRASAATVIAPDGSGSRLPAAVLRPGMVILTAAGERFAIDGKLTSGSTEVDESLITGETRPRAATVGDTVYAGTINLGQPVTTEALTTGHDTLIAEIARLMAAAEQGRARYVRLADRAARIYAPAVHALGLATFIGWMMFGYGWESALTAAIAVLIITCPCALALAVPAVQVAATSRLFGIGVLVKSPDALERLADIDTVVFDKTGTLTLGEPTLSSEAGPSDEVLRHAAELASSSRHPYARAVVRAAKARGIDFANRMDVAEKSGLGLSRHTPLGEERLGSASWCGVEDDGETALWYRRGTEPAIAFSMQDRLRRDAPEVVRALQSAGLATELLSGDRANEVGRVANALRIEQQTSRVKPADKQRRLAELENSGRKVLMVGDGLNDAPALAAAHASISPASAAGISQTAADVIFQGEALAPIIETIAVARESRRMAVQNFGIALGYNAIFVPLAVIGVVTPLLAAVAMSASSIAVTANALRLRTKSLSLGRRRLAP